MKTFYSVTLSLLALVVLGGGVASAQTTSEPTTAELQQQIQQLQEQIEMLQAQVDGDQSEDEDDEEDEDESEEEEQESDGDEDATSTSNALPEQAAMQARIARQLDQGDRGPDVRKLQELLASNSDIYPEGLVTGYYGELTSQAVSRLQQRSGLPSVGRVGPRTLQQVNSLMENGAGQSGVIPSGLLQAPGLQGRMDAGTSSSATSSEMDSGTSTDMTDEDEEDEEGEEAEDNDQSRGQGTGPGQNPGGPPQY